MENKIFSGFLFVFLFLTCPATAFATTYYVNPSGSDTGTGAGTSATPFKTLTKGVSVLQPGDTLYVSGDYNTTLTINKSGTAAAPIKVIGQNMPKIIAGNANFAINLAGSYLIVDGFDASGGSDHGIYTEGKHNQILNNKLHDSVLSNKGTGTTCTGTNGWGSGIKLRLGAEDVLIKGNEVYENCGEGIAATRAINTRIENNIVRDNFSVNIYIDNSPFSIASNNQVSCTGIYLRNGRRMAGIVAAEEYYAGWGVQRHDITINNNTSDGCDQGVSAWAAQSQPSPIPAGKFINGTITGNKIINGTADSIKVRSVNENVIISNNQIYTPINFIDYAGHNYSAGVTTSNNTISNTPPSPTPSSTFKSGDANGDSRVDGVDYVIWLNHYNQSVSGANNGDFNNSGKVDGVDYVLWLSNYGQ